MVSAAYFITIHSVAKLVFIGHLRWDELGFAEFNKFCRWQNLAP